MNILIVDDEPIVLESLERLLAGLGPDTWDILCASSGAKALEVMASTHVDLVITDMRMPNMDGVELLTTTAARWPKIARFALSAVANDLMAIRATSVAHQYLGKPCRANTMLAALNQLDCWSSGSEADAVRALVGAVPRLPALPNVFLELRSLLADPRSDARKVSDLVKQDPGITAKVMQLASSSFFFRGSAVADVHGAVSRLGASLISRLVLVEGLLAASPAAAHFGFDRDAREFFRAALLAEASVSPGTRDEAALATLLCPIGRVVMIAAAPDRVEQAMALSAAGLTIAAAEREVFGTSHAAVGGHLLSLWGLPTTVCAAVAAQHTPARYMLGGEISAATALANRDVRGLLLDPGFLSSNTALVATWDRHKTRSET